MDNNNWRPSLPGGESAMDSGDWRAQLPPDSRPKIVTKIMETLKKHLPLTGPDGINELRRIAARFEEKIFSSALSQTDYLRKISMKMLTMETKSPPNAAGSATSISNVNNSMPLDSGSTGMPSQGQSLSASLPPNQSQASQQILSQNMQNNMSPGISGSAALPSSMPPVSSMSNNNNNSNNITGMMQDSSGGSMAQGLASNMYSGSQRQMQGRPHTMSSQQQQQQQQQQQPAQNAQYLYQQQLQQQLLKQNFQQGNVPNSLMQSHIQQQQQQKVLQPNQMHSSQQPGIATSAIQPSVNTAPLSGLHANQQLSGHQQTQSMLRQHQPSLLRPHQQSQQASGMHQQQASLPQQSVSSMQQQQAHLLRQQAANSSGIQQNQMIGQQNLAGDMQQQQQQQQQQHQQRLIGQQHNLVNIQQQQQQPQQQSQVQQQQQQQQQPGQQQLMSQQNSLQTMHQQQMSSQSNVSGLQQPQQQLLGSQVGNQGLQTSQQSMHMLSQSKAGLQQRAHQTGPGLLPSQGQQLQNQPSQQQMMPQLQSHHQQVGMQQQSNLMQHDVQQRLQASGQVAGSLLQTQNVMDQQRQLYQSQRPLPEITSSQTGNANGGDWQEEVYQKIKTMRDMYFLDLKETYQRLSEKMQQHESLPQQQRSEQFEKLKQFKAMLERLISFLSVSKSAIVPALKDRVGQYEKQIINFLNMNRPRRPLQQQQQQQQQQQLSQSQMQSLQQQQQPQTQSMQGQSHDNQASSQMQSMQGSVARSQQSGLTNLQHSSLSSLPGVSVPHQNMSNSIMAPSLEAGQGNALNNGQQVGAQQNPSQQVNNSSATSQSGLNAMQSSSNLVQPNSTMLQHQLLKQQDQQMPQQQQQQLKQQLQQRQMQQQMIQKQQLLQHQQRQQQQLQTRQQMSDVNDSNNNNNNMTMRHGMSVGRGMFQQHPLQGQRSYQQLKPGTQLPVSSPQVLQGTSPQMMQHLSPQVDQKNLSGTNKTGTPLQSASSPFVVPSPQTPLAPSPMPAESEKPVIGVSSLSNAGNSVRQQATGVQGVAQSLAIGTPGISASPLLQDIASPDGNNVNPLTSVSGKSSSTEQPIDRLVRAMKSVSSRALTEAISDIGSVVTMVDRIAGSAPGNGSRASVGEDLVAMTKCRLQARNLMTQDGMSGTKRMKRHTSAVPSSVASSGGSISDNFKQFASSETTSDLESTATSTGKRRRTEKNHALLEEIRETNQRLIDTVVEISDEDGDRSAAVATEGGEGTIVRLSFVAVSLSPSLKSYLSSTQMCPIQPLRLLVPSTYPNCSPLLLDKPSADEHSRRKRKEKGEIWAKAQDRFSISLRSLSQPMSVKEIAKTWDACARAVICEFAHQFGGGTFSSKYGTWEKFVAAA